MPGLLADVNADLYLDAVVAVCRSAAWLDLWNDLNVRVMRFSSLGLAADAPDADIWHLCQREELLLFTDNRNSDREDSLQATIATYVTPIANVAALFEKFFQRSSVGGGLHEQPRRFIHRKPRRIGC